MNWLETLCELLINICKCKSNVQGTCKVHFSVIFVQRFIFVIVFIRLPPIIFFLISFSFFLNDHFRFCFYFVLVFLNFNQFRFYFVLVFGIIFFYIIIHFYRTPRFNWNSCTEHHFNEHLCIGFKIIKIGPSKFKFNDWCRL